MPLVAESYRWADAFLAHDPCPALVVTVGLSRLPEVFQRIPPWLHGMVSRVSGRRPPEQASLFEEDYLVRSLGSIANDPGIALTELVANAWDAGATEVQVDIPYADGGHLRVSDDGSGMTAAQFAHRWLTLGYNRIKHQGSKTEFPPERASMNRWAFGSAGIGRHGMLCFADRYEVRTWRDGTGHSFVVAARSGPTPFVRERSSRIPTSAPDSRVHGTVLVAEVKRHFPAVERMRNVLSARFLYDPAFRVEVNGEAVRLEHLPGKEMREVKVDGHPPIYVTWFDAESTGRTSQHHGIAFWVGGRLVGHPSWNVADQQVLDGRTREAKRLTAIVKADAYQGEVLSDWTGFKYSEAANGMQEAAAAHAMSFLREYMADRIEETKAAVLGENSADLEELGPRVQHEAAEFVETMARQDPLLGRASLSIAIQALIRLEQTRSGRALLQKLITMEPADIDGLHRLLDEWSVQDALAVLDEIDRRIRTVEAIEKLCGDPGVHETKTLHPLVTNARWLFGPEYESPLYASNVTIRTALEALFAQRLPAEDFTDPKKRPDLIFLPDATLSAVGLDEWEDGVQLVATRKILLLELKRGGDRIGEAARNQALGYVEAVRNSPHLENAPDVEAWVVGAKRDPKVSSPLRVDGGIVRLATYNQLVRSASARLFRLRSHVTERYDVRGVSLQLQLHAEEPDLFEG